MSCASTTLTIIASDLNKWSIPSNLTLTEVVSECDYYEWGTGYMFSEIDNGVGTVILESKVESDISGYYKALSPSKSI
jgi:hypothetical protein